MISLYVHIPFCLSKCHYCDFFSLGWGKAPIPEAEFCRALRQEWQQRQEELIPSALAAIPTVFFGGGTPSLFSPEAIGQLLQDLGIGREADGEVTLELNPKTADRAKLRELRDRGVNRISMGLQSLDDPILEKLGRAHSAREALDSLELALATGFKGINVDIMYGLPYQNLKNLTDTLDGLAAYPLSHLSAYELILEEHTPFYDRYRYDRKPLPDTEAILQMRTAIEDFSAGKGMGLYEISNWARPGGECRHNLRYWDYESFLGLGAGAVSFLRWEELSPDLQSRWKNSDEEIPFGLRWTNPRDLRGYLEHPGELNHETMEWISYPTAQTEFMMMGLRKAKGIRYVDFKEKFHSPFPENFHQAAQRSVRRGWIRQDSEGMALTEAGRQFSNEVLQEFL